MGNQHPAPAPRLRLGSSALTPEIHPAAAGLRFTVPPHLWGCSAVLGVPSHPPQVTTAVCHTVLLCAGRCAAERLLCVHAWSSPACTHCFAHPCTCMHRAAWLANPPLHACTCACREQLTLHKLLCTHLHAYARGAACLAHPPARVHACSSSACTHRSARLHVCMPPFACCALGIQLCMHGGACLAHAVCTGLSACAPTCVHSHALHVV